MSLSTIDWLLFAVGFGDCPEAAAAVASNMIPMTARTQ
jgi:hypothetical protein